MESVVIAAIWAVVILVLGLLWLWRLDLWLNSRQELKAKIQELDKRERELALTKQEYDQEIAERTQEEAVALRKAKLDKEAAETRAAMGMIDDLRDDRLAAERRAIDARAAARERLAEELVRDEHAVQLDPKQLIDLYNKHWHGHSATTYPSLDTFAATLRRHCSPPRT